MERTEAITGHINEGYTCKGDHIILGSAIFEGEAIPGAYVKVPLKTMDRHELISGATGTGKTKSLQIISEHLSEKGFRYF